jgi:uncharacterized repeat protein (TIGR01451 family)
LVTVGESATNALLRITDTAGHRGDSMLFDVRVVPAADVALMMSATPNPAVPGSNIVYVLTVTNRGPSSATEVVLTNWMPAGFEYITASSSQGAVVSSNGTVTAVLGTVAVLQAVEVRITLRPHAVGSYTNIAVVNASSADPTLVNNYANVTCTVWLDADGDGMPDAWEQQYNLNPNNAADALLDADADGQNNLDEFKSGTNPQDANSVMRITNIVVVGGDVRMQFHGVLGRTYRLERLDGTNPDRWTTVLVFQTGSSANVQIVDTGGAGRPTMIYRISLLR